MTISEEDIIYVGWKNAYTHNGGGKRVSIVRSIDGGHSWTHPYDMPMFNNSITEQSDPWLYHYNGTIYYAYLEFETGYFENPSGDYFSQITVAKTSDYDFQWNIVKGTHGEYFADKEMIHISKNGTIYIVYNDVAAMGTIKLSRSIDGGANYDEISTIGSDPYYTGPYLVTNSSNDIFIAWSWLNPSGGDILFSKSSDGGFSFESPIDLNDDGNFAYGEFVQGSVGKTTLPVLQFDPYGRLYALWADKFDTHLTTYDVYLRYSDDYGATWSSRMRINPSIEGHQWHPSMAIDSSGRLHIAYYHENYGTYRPYYRVLNFTGPNRDIAVFNDPIPIAETTTSNKFTRPGEYLAIQLDSHNRPHIAWSDGRNDEMDIYYTQGVLAGDIDYSINFFIFTIFSGSLSIIILTFMLLKRRD